MGVLSNDVVNSDQVFVSSNKVAINKFINSLESTVESGSNDTVKPKQGFGIGVFVDLRDSNGVVIPQDSNFLAVSELQSLIGANNELLDFTKFQFDITALTVYDDDVQVTVNYDVVSNENVFISGKAYGNGKTVNKEFNLKFEQGDKIGDAVEIDFEKNEVPGIITGTNTLEVRITHVEAVVGSSFETKHYKWDGSFPILTVKYESDPTTRTVRDYRGVAVQTLPNDVGIKVCGYDNGRLFPGQDFPAFAPTITVKDSTGKIVLVSSQPLWGNRDADFNSLKCSSISSGLERNTNYSFVMHDGSVYQVTTPETPILYSATCVIKTAGTYQSPQTLFPCSSNFGWSR